MLLSDESETVKKKQQKKKKILTFLVPFVLWRSRCLVELSQAGEEFLLEDVLLLILLITFWSRLEQPGTPASGPGSQEALNNPTQPVTASPLTSWTPSDGS